MTPEMEGQFLRHLDRMERRDREDGEKLRSVQAEVRSLIGSVDKLSTKVDKANDALVTVRVEGERMNARLQNVERRVVEVEDSVDKTAEVTGRHEVDRLHAQLKKYEANSMLRRKERSAWMLWVAGIAATTLAGAGGYVLKALIGG